MWELIKAGGWLMLPLVLCSIFTVAISIERFIRLKRGLVMPNVLLMHKDRNVETVINELQSNKIYQNTALGTIFNEGAEAYAQGETYARAQMEVAASREIGYLEKNINFLGTLSAVSPLLGLLGTVVGIIESFLTIDLASGTDPAMMIPGLSKALITTAAGMAVAIPALFSYRYFQRLVQDYVVELEQQATLFHSALFYQAGHQTKNLNAS
ncbi:MotA/TolQ/ExbB proton channel family protein [Acinetobacter shaoyimingii]|uniref:MotA/TolQ/ExbB proton channel family protein n=1 Tax=Acinetobacter shaoyimingii TaxID=2715164 RepID=A0A6G8RWD3_9GAMM|nr:MotA/TolQ/ExbB proton channel family protein [Acinetobacter shaoyimingii]QIO06185.1 MotA/TolQ/ExbB proton channel family protein [Acinetobacter shaoyimingii]